MPEAFAAVREVSWLPLRMRLRRAAPRRRGASRGPDRRDEDRRGQDPGGHAARLSQRPGGTGVHVFTVNDYLARRDRDWMQVLLPAARTDHRIVVHDLDDRERYEAYRYDITYGTNNEMGFDYLRDNMKFELEHCVQRPHWYAIVVDEVDSILIDEARTPLIISGPSEKSTDKYYRIDRIVPSSSATSSTWWTREAHLRHPDRGRHPQGREAAGCREPVRPVHMDLQHHIGQALRALAPIPAMTSNYVVKDGQVLIVDEFTGRLMPGRRWSDERAPGGGGQRGGQDRAREPDPGHRHLPELLPDVQAEAKHDGHGVHRGRGSSGRSTSSRSTRSPPTRRWSAATMPMSSTAPSARSSTPSSTRSSSSTSKPAGAREHRDHRQVRAHLQDAHPGRASRTMC